MFRLTALTICAVLWLATTAEAMETVTLSTSDGPLPCHICDSEYVPGTRIVILGHGGEVQEIHGSELSFVGHGWGGPLQSCVEELSSAELCAFQRDHCQFELTINGARVAPSYMAIWPYEIEGQATWAVRWYFEFPAGSLAPGVHILTGNWILADYPCACDPSACLDESYTAPAWSVADGVLNRHASSRTFLTLSVVYP